ncbi:hypothetical protein EYF80_012458 [Liparis tanakae]|uniref:Uncharacterized protein n=1 Tax=Liparis tanakae TaxID=230148 RepID=A0A4Z2IIS9_9TELE|nr:hypothetical protein EYF80_012458 [Liparis tanakae]
MKWRTGFESTTWWLQDDHSALSFTNMMGGSPAQPLLAFALLLLLLLVILLFLDHPCRGPQHKASVFSPKTRCRPDSENCGGVEGGH